MQVFVNKEGENLKLNKTERKRLSDALSLCMAIKRHGGDGLSENAELAAANLELVLEKTVEEA